MKISMEELERMLKEENVIIYDVRSENFYKEGHIKGAVSKPLTISFSDFTKDIKKDDTKKVFYCNGGNTSSTVVKTLIKLKYENIYDFGSIKNWKYELERG